MRKIIYLISILFIFKTSYSQKKYSLGFSLGLGKNYFVNSFNKDEKHFEFNSPNSLLLGIQFVKLINQNNQIVTQFSYSTKKVKLEYNTNEPEIPYNVNEIITDKYDCLSLSVGYRKPIKIWKKSIFAQIDLTSDYNVNFAQSNSGTGNGTRDFNEEILYKSFILNNLGQKSFTIGTTLSSGFYLGKNKKSEISLNVNIPFNNIHNKTSNYQYVWQYQGKEYVHNIDYKGKIIYPSIKYTFYAFSK